jgi:hypothetical protein
MRQFLLDEIPHRHMEAIEEYLKKKTIPSGLEKIFWLEIPENLLSPIQGEHQACGPHYLAVELGQDFLKFEFLVRCRKRLRCDCVQYATQVQEAYLLDFARALIQTIGLSF